jgi:hypothetical protein
MYLCTLTGADSVEFTWSFCVHLCVCVCVCVWICMYAHVCLAGVDNLET